jgi:hypothetical protein
MKKLKIISKIMVILPVLLGLFLAGCTVEAPDASQGLRAPQGEEYFDSYVALGNSLTAGFMDGGLARPGQANSFPMLIAHQIGTPEFTQPTVALPGVGSTRDPINHPADIAGVLAFNGTSIGVLDWTPYNPPPATDPTGGLLENLTQPTPYHNLGVPGAKLLDVMNTYSSAQAEDPSEANTFFDFINRASFFGNVTVPPTAGLPGYETASMFGAGVAKGPKLVTLWIGNNDILGPATSGNDLFEITAQEFGMAYNGLLFTLAGGLQVRTGWPATIVVANIPSITSIPYFVPREALEAQFGVHAGGYSETDVSLVTFPLLTWIMDPAHADLPIPGNFTLTAGEVAAIETMVNTFNGIIAQAVQDVNALGLADCGLMDAHALMAGLDPAQRTHFLFLVQTMGLEAANVTLFSLDGIHPNNVGYGVVANGFIEVINQLAGTDVPAVDLSGLSWDPTYSEYQPLVPAAGNELLTREAAAAMKAVWQ